MLYIGCRQHIVFQEHWLRKKEKKEINDDRYTTWLISESDQWSTTKYQMKVIYPLTNSEYIKNTSRLKKTNLKQTASYNKISVLYASLYGIMWL